MGAEVETCYIYALKDPRDGKYRYVGKSVNPEGALSRYASKASRDSRRRKYRWIAELNEEGMEPIIEILEEVPNQKDVWRPRKRKWSLDLKLEGHPLLSGQGGHTKAHFEGDATALWRNLKRENPFLRDGEILLGLARGEIEWPEYFQARLRKEREDIEKAREFLDNVGKANPADIELGDRSLR